MSLQEFLFQFTLPCRERPGLAVSEERSVAFQFTLPCRERLGIAGGLELAGRVSIHAPV